MPGVFRRRWFPTRRVRGGLTALNDTINLTGLQSTSAATTFAFQSTGTITGVAATTHVPSITPLLVITATGDAVATAVSAPYFSNFVAPASGQAGIAEFSPFHNAILFNLQSQSATASFNQFEFITNFNSQGNFVTATGFFASLTTVSTAILGVEVVTGFGATLTTAPGPRTFWIAGVRQNALSPGIVMLPTSEDLTLVNSPYVIGSSQFYTVGEVHWNGAKRVQGVDWDFVQPFSHIIEILVNPATISTVVTLIYYRWDIGMRSGFQVTSYPVEFAFDRTSIIAERVPPVNSFFTVSYSDLRPGTNPVTMFARYPIMIDDVLVNHLSYDGSLGFDTYRPAGYKVFDIADNFVYTWNGSAWGTGVALATNTTFYSKRQRSIYIYDGTGSTVLFQSGDLIDNTFPETLTYPAFGESIGKNLLEDAFSANASVQYPSAYEIAQRPGFYDDWLDI